MEHFSEGEKHSPSFRDDYSWVQSEFFLDTCIEKYAHTFITKVYILFTQSGVYEP